ncbi:MAG TPA: cell division control protein 6, partial [Methanomicrobiales archaeon]|nr:cell division control protein 6 [Methanomicrobiales archaeon]
DLLKRAGLSAEKAARRSIERDDVCRAYEVSRYLHLAFTVKTLKDEEKEALGYTRFYEMVKKLDAMRLVNLSYRDGRGRTRLISLRYEPGRVLEYLR